MTSGFGFGTVPDELRDAATKIGDAISRVSEMVWQGPSGEYGHRGVQTGWAHFIDDMKAQVDTLRAKAEGHGQGLVSAAGTYVESETDIGQNMAQAGSQLDALRPLGGTGSTHAGGQGFAGSDIASILNPASADTAGPATR